jgi:cytochrome c oxidase assembly factor CtaG
MRSIALDWSLDGPTGAAALAVIAILLGIYLTAARHGRQRDRRHRRWPARRAVYFSTACLLLVIDLYSWLGIEADRRVDVHMLEHMIMWSVVAPLIAASAPVRMAFYALGSTGRRRLAALLHARVVALLSEPVVASGLFSVFFVATQLPAVYKLSLSNDYLHELEHGLYLLTATLMWASLLRVDPLPRRSGSGQEHACLIICMLPMGLTSLWLAAAGRPIYGRSAGLSLSASMHEQKLAAIVMALSCLPALAMLARTRTRARDYPRKASSISAGNPSLAGAELGPGSAVPPSTGSA